MPESKSATHPRQNWKPRNGTPYPGGDRPHRKPFHGPRPTKDENKNRTNKTKEGHGGLQEGPTQGFSSPRARQPRPRRPATSTSSDSNKIARAFSRLRVQMRRWRGCAGRRNSGGRAWPRWPTKPQPVDGQGPIRLPRTSGRKCTPVSETRAVVSMYAHFRAATAANTDTVSGAGVAKAAAHDGEDRDVPGFWQLRRVLRNPHVSRTAVVAQALIQIGRRAPKVCGVEEAGAPLASRAQARRTPFDWKRQRARRGSSFGGAPGSRHNRPRHGRRIFFEDLATERTRGVRLPEWQAETALEASAEQRRVDVRIAGSGWAQ